MQFIDDQQMPGLPRRDQGTTVFNPLIKIADSLYGKGLQPDIELNNSARNSLDVVKNSNLQIPELVMPRSLITMSSGYNILSDQFGNG